MSYSMKNLPKVMILDRDGTLIEHVHHLVDPMKVALLANVGQVLRSFSDRGVKFVVVTNQSVIERGLASAQLVGEIHRVIDNLLLEFGVRIEAYYVCPHLASTSCLCRKPRIRHGLSILQEFSILPSAAWVIGDQESDMEFAKNLGSEGIKLNPSNLSEFSVASKQFSSWSDFHVSTQKEFW